MIPEKLGHLGSDKAARGTNRKSRGQMRLGEDREGIHINEGAATPPSTVTAGGKKVANGMHLGDD